MKNLLIISIVVLFTLKFAFAEELSYSGRLVHANGSPVTGSVDLRFDLAYSGAPTVVICSKTVNGVVLSNGVFHVNLDVENSDCTPSKAFTAVLRDVPVSESVVIQVTDLSNSKIYPHQALKAVPFSIQANVAKTLSVQGTNGQVLKLVAGEWVAADGGGSGSVTEIQTGSGLSGGPITSTGTISIATNGVTSSHILDGTITNTDINASAGIARSKIAGGLANHVVVNDGAGLLSVVSHLPVSLGGTGAGIASDARNNLGLGNVATRDVGLNSGNVLLADEVPSCLVHQKIQKTALAPYIFSCADDNDSADASKLPLLGGTMLGAINMGGFAITNLVDPTNPQDAATRNYVHNYVASELLGVSESQWVDSGSDIYFSAGNVGIGKTTPSKLLDVNGDILVNGVTIGRGGGNDSLNTAVGAYALNSNSGNYNSAFGYFASSSNTSATSNTSVGFSSLSGITIGSYNTAIGRDSGHYIADGVTTNQTSSNSVYFGSFTKALANGGTNEIVIGYNTIGNGSNSVTLGNDLITKTILKGNVGIGANNPGAKLEVAGQIKITGGSPGAGKVLTSDGSGLATWETPSTPTTGSINSSHILDGSIVDADINASAAIAQSKIANLTTDLAAKQAADADLSAIAALSSYGILVRNSDNSFVTRTLMGAAGRTFVSNSNGATGNPTIDISNSLLPSPIAGDEGKFLKVSGPGVSVWSALASGDITTALGFTPVNKAGDTMTGALTLSADPTNNLHAATKQYVDSAVNASGPWTLSGGNVYRSSGNVGIGTTNPQVTLSLGGSFYMNSANQIHISNSGSSSRVALGEDNNNHGEMTWHDLFDAMIFNTKRAGTTYSNNLVLKDGKVGIGATSPARALDIQTSLTGDGVRITNSHISGSTSYGAYSASNNILMVNWAGGDSNYLSSTNTLGLKIQSSAHTIFQTDGFNERMRITTTGDVGIGTGSPGAKLDINGQIKISGGLPGLGKVLTSNAVGLATWETPAASGITALTGDVTASGSGSVAATIANNAVTSAKITDATIVDADIANTTITYGKLNLADQSIPVVKLVRLTCLAGEVITSDAVLGYRCVSDNTTDTTKVPLAGGTMTGLLTLSANPTANLHAATKQYVDTQISGLGSVFINNGNNFGGNAVLGTNGAGQSLAFETAGTTRMTISATGEVGIGRAPLAGTKLSTLGNILIEEGELSIENYTSGVAGRLNLHGAGDTYNYATFYLQNHDWTRYWGFGHRKEAGYVNDFFIEEYNGSTYTTQFVIKPGGNTGIGTRAPNAKLTVEGSLSLREGTAPATTANYGKIYVSSTDSKLYFVNDSGTSMELGVNNAVGASTTSTINFASSNMVRSTKATSCGTLAVSGTTAGKTYTLTMPNTTATCLLPATIDGLTVKAPIGYLGGNTVDGIVYTLINDGFNVWISHVDF